MSGELIAEGTGGSYGLPGQGFEVVEVRVRRLGGRYAAEGEWVQGANQGWIEEHHRLELAAVASDPFDAVRELRCELERVGAPTAETAEACSGALVELAERFATQNGDLERATVEAG